MIYCVTTSWGNWHVLHKLVEERELAGKLARYRHSVSIELFNKRKQQKNKPITRIWKLEETIE